MLPSREALVGMVKEWMAGERSTRSVHEWAEELEHAHVYSPEYALGPPQVDPIASEVLLRLSFLNVELITPEDGPAILAFLGASPEDTSAAWEAWRAYWNSLDLDKRKLSISKDPSAYNYYT
ncbi:MAG TPA: hypothetical protein VN193_14295 [Candidatus Angelobacter sp.]|jgi:hypothetical protein|nr:hypothetical protein [Candidatus Angelobacter sp.]